MICLCFRLLKATLMTISLVSDWGGDCGSVETLHQDGGEGGSQQQGWLLNFHLFVLLVGNDKS